MFEGSNPFTRSFPRSSRSWIRACFRIEFEAVTRPSRVLVSALSDHFTDHFRIFWQQWVFCSIRPENCLVRIDSQQVIHRGQQ